MVRMQQRIRDACGVVAVMSLDTLQYKSKSVSRETNVEMKS